MANETALDTMIQSYTDKVKGNPDSLLFVQLADAYRKKGMYDKGIEVLETGLARHANLLSALLMMGRIYSAKRQYPEAIEALKKVAQREPANMTAHALLSQAYVSLSRWTEAIATYQKILSLNPEDTAAQSALRNALEQLRQGRAAPSSPQPSVQGPIPAVATQPLSAMAAPSAPRPQRSASPPKASEGGVQPFVAAVPPSTRPPVRSASPPESAVVVSRLGAAVEPRHQMEAPAYAAAEELAARGLYDEAIEALQRMLEADPDNFMARQKLREVYAQREAMESPSAGSLAARAMAAPAVAAGGVTVAGSGGGAAPAAGAGSGSAEAPADKITDDEILYLLGLMEDASVPAVPTSPPPSQPVPPPKPAMVVNQRAAAVTEVPHVSVPAPVRSAAPPKPAVVVDKASVAAEPPIAAKAVVPAPKVSQPTPVAVVEPKPEPVQPAASAPPEPAVAEAAEPVVAVAPAEAVPPREAVPPPPQPPAPEGMGEELKAKVTGFLERLASTEGLRQAYFVSGTAVMTSGQAPPEDQSAKIVTLVNMVADLTRRAASSMKQGDVKQVLVFGTDGLVMVCPAKAGVLAAVAGGGVKVGLLRIALNDCLKRLAEVS